MDVGTVSQRIQEVAAVCSRPEVSTAEGLAGLRAVAEVRAWLAATEARLVQRLTEGDPHPEHAIAEATRSSVGLASATVTRARTLAAAPRLAEALSRGRITVGHVDALTQVAKGLAHSEAAALVRCADELTTLATHGTVGEFRQRLQRAAQHLRDQSDGTPQQRQRADRRVRWWADPATGMWQLHGRFDPLTGAGLQTRLEAAVERLEAGGRLPPGCPTEPLARRQFLAAVALEGLLRGEASQGDGAVGRPEYVIVIHTDGAGGAGPSDDGCANADLVDDPAQGPGPSRSSPWVEWRLPVEVPWRVLADLHHEADVHTVVVRNGVVLHAPGRLQLGRTTRLANRAQHRALRALYTSCAIPGCDVHFEHCRLHHVQWWRHGGRTDLANLLPVCVHHHSLVHAGQLTLHLHPDRALTVTGPQGTTRTVPPPGPPPGPPPDPPPGRISGRAA